MTKYGSKSVTRDGIRFDSKAEATRYLDLLILKSAGVISDLRIHPVFVIWEHHPHAKRRCDRIEYEADFFYLENGQIVVEDVKGILTPVYRLKKKMFLAKYPEFKFVEVKA